MWSRVAVGVGVVLVIAGGWLVLSGADEPTAPPPVTAPKNTEAPPVVPKEPAEPEPEPEPEPQPEPDEIWSDPADEGAEVDEPEPDVDADAEKIARAGVEAYTQYGYTDKNPDAWIERVGKLATPGFHTMLRTTFASDERAESYWQREVVEPRMELRTQVVSSHLSGMHDQSKKKAVFVVTYETTFRQGDSDWSQPGGQMSQFVTVVKQKGHWRVADIVPTSDRR